eukprot:2662044-Pyramimonas_sp.AAC.1
MIAIRAAPACSSTNASPVAVGVDYRPAMWQYVGREYTSNIRWNIRNDVRLLNDTSVDSRRQSTVELKSEAILAVDSGACTNFERANKSS